MKSSPTFEIFSFCLSGANSFVLSLADVDLSDADLFHCLVRCRELGVLLQIHAEDRNFLKEVGCC